MAFTVTGSQAVGGGSTIAVARPAGAATNGTPMIAFHRPGFGQTSTPPTGGATWNLRMTLNVNANHREYIYTKDANNEPASEAWPNDAGGSAAIYVMAIGGGGPAAGIQFSAAAASGASNTTINAPTLTTTADGSLIIRNATEGSGNAPSASWPAGLTERCDFGAVVMTVATEDAVKSPAGAVGTKLCTWSVFVGTNAQAAVTLAVPPAPSDSTAPIADITIGPDRTLMSRQPGADSSIFTFSVNEAVQGWQVRIVPGSLSPVTAGTLVESGGALASGATQQVTITDDELVAAGATEGAMTIKVFAQDSAGNWSI